MVSPELVESLLWQARWDRGETSYHDVIEDAINEGISGDVEYRILSREIYLAIKFGTYVRIMDWVMRPNRASVFDHYFHIGTFFKYFDTGKSSGLTCIVDITSEGVAYFRGPQKDAKRPTRYLNFKDFVKLNGVRV